MIKGKKVYLSAIEENELEQLRKWRNLPEYRKHFREYRDISASMQRKWFENVVNNDNSTIDRKSTRLNSSHPNPSRMPSSA